MGVFNFYIKPFNDDGTYATDWIDVTDDANKSSISSLKRDLDNTDFDTGVFRYSNFTLSLRNSHGKYGDVGVSGRSIFKYKRSDSLIKITWRQNPLIPVMGFIPPGELWLHEELEIFQGLLNDETLSLDLETQDIDFRVLGKESIFSRVETPFSILNNNDTIKEIIYDCLNQTEITNLLTVNLANINPTVNAICDLIAEFENTTVQEVLDSLLVASNSYLYIQNDTIYVTDKTPGATTSFKFYGQASSKGPENLMNIGKIKNGVSKVNNYITWKETTLLSYDIDSVNKYGVRKKEVGYDFITNTTQRNNILASYKNGFKDPKETLELETPMRLDSAKLFLKDGVKIDYPTNYYSSEGLLPICGIAICGQARTPNKVWFFTISDTVVYMITGITINMRNESIVFKLRGV